VKMPSANVCKPFNWLARRDLRAPPSSCHNQQCGRVDINWCVRGLVGVTHRKRRTPSPKTSPSKTPWPGHSVKLWPSSRWKALGFWFSGVSPLLERFRKAVFAWYQCPSRRFSTFAVVKKSKRSFQNGHQFKAGFQVGILLFAGFY